MKRKYLIVSIIVPLILAIDQLTKTLVARYLELGEGVDVIPGVFQLYYTLNPGAAFGLFAGLSAKIRNPFFTATSIIAIGLVFYFIIKADDRQILFPTSLAMVLGGALGNIMDRVRLHGYVVDFLDFYIINWPAFNVADSAVTIGIVLMMTEVIMSREAKEETKE